MYIAVICGGLSAERDVSISSGTGAAHALRVRGHKVALVDLFLGTPSAEKDPRSVFTSDAGDSVYSVRETEPDLDKIRAQRGGVLPVVGDAYHRRAIPVPQDIRRRLLPRLRVQPLERLVQQQKPAAEAHRPGDGHPPPLPAG